MAKSQWSDVDEAGPINAVVHGAYPSYKTDDSSALHEEYEKDEGDDHDGKQSENEDKVDDIMDEENNIEDVDVDMTNFFLNVESDVEGACINDGHEPEDMEMINNEEFESLHEGSDQDRERIALIKNLGKEKRLRALCRGVVPVINKGQVGTQPTTSKSKGKEALELQATNPDITVKINVCPNGNPASPTRQFRRIYVCLGPLKKGFKACLRDLVGLDGAFMKGPFPASWKWFLENLGDDLELGSNSNYTFISDRQKHRYCIRHIHDNMRKKLGQTEYRDHLWRCASATTIPEFEHLMKEFSEYDKEACQWLKQIPPVHWSRIHFSVLNGKIEKGRDKPIISCLEFIREYIMKRICNVMKAMKKAKGPLTPTATDILDARKKGTKLALAESGELMRIPCRYAIATLNEMSKDPDVELDNYKWVHKVYWLETWQKAYSFKVEPIKGRPMWPKSNCPTKLIPPPHRTLVGRPKKK
uniref:Transposase MuDR plant domain-containing protein n=1 Tax=Lactuca sativa TaxID=4236 RepID=A0A9R1X792_LACSA|nr:hypothetical protein LSAT_V11C500271460 [Lactuca sativa]